MLDKSRDQRLLPNVLGAIAGPDSAKQLQVLSLFHACDDEYRRYHVVDRVTVPQTSSATWMRVIAGDRCQLLN